MSPAAEPRRIECSAESALTHVRRAVQESVHLVGVAGESLPGLLVAYAFYADDTVDSRSHVRITLVINHTGAQLLVPWDAIVELEFRPI